MDHHGLIETILRYWSVQDVEQTLGLCADTVVYQLNIAPGTTGLLVPPEAGCQAATIEQHGKDAVRAMMYDVLAKFDYLHYETTILDIHDGVARIHIDYMLRHRATGEELTGSKRFVLGIEDGLVARIDEYLDAARVGAFLRLTHWRLAQQHVTA